MIADSSLGSRCNEGIQIAEREKVTALVRGVENEAFKDGRRKSFNHRGHGGSRGEQVLSRYAESRNPSSSKLISKGVRAARCAFLFLVEGH